MILPKIKKTVKDFLLSEDGRISKQAVIKAGIISSIIGVGTSIFSKEANAGSEDAREWTDVDPWTDNVPATTFCFYPKSTGAVAGSGWYHSGGTGKDYAADDPSGKPGAIIHQGSTTVRCGNQYEEGTCHWIGHQNSLGIEKTSDEKLIATHAHAIKTGSTPFVWWDQANLSDSSPDSSGCES
ncbi:hypothetical protein HZB03_02730 [Candidatus Woesearchaeota archaeon]|nr:hypothetical protein [Candidatus Woesearchaeota archaeon]